MFWGKQTKLYLNCPANSEQFDSICLYYAYQLVESVIFLGKYENNLYHFNPSSVICKISSKQFFYKNEFYQNK